MTPLYVFPIGGRGDFLISILHGNVLERDWDKSVVNWPLLLNNNVKPVKIHDFGPGLSWNNTNNVIGPTDIKKYYAIRISVPDRQQLLSVAYLSAYKRSNNEPMSAALVEGRVNLTLHYEETFKQYDNDFQHVIEFNQLFDIEFIKDLYTKIRNKWLTNEEIDRIKFNIGITRELLRQNPYMIIPPLQVASRF